MSAAETTTRNENLLVVAGAGTGKTHNLVQTVVERLKDETAPLGVDELLIVTFTKAAAAELRQRIAEALQKELAAHPDSTHLARQIAMLDRAQISTLHSFCLELVSRDFSELGLSPRLATLEAAQASALAKETLDELFESYYEPAAARARAIHKMLLEWFKGNDLHAREIVQALHKFTQSRPNPAGWFAEQRALFDNPEPTRWRHLYDEAVTDWLRANRGQVEAQPAEGNPARALILARMESRDLPGLAEIVKNSAAYPRGTAGKYRDPLRTFFAEAASLAGWARTDGSDPIVEDWNFTRETALLLLDIAQEFQETFANVKRERGAVDFHDLEQFSLQLLWDEARNEPTARASFWRQKFRWIFVDEYQDINPVQDRIIQALSRPDAVGNRYLVGDAKQSIYGFRQADSRIFTAYQAAWSGGAAGRVHFLSRNWRSHERILDFVNGLFSAIMTPDSGGVAYDENACLKFADIPERAQLSKAADPRPRVEVHLLKAKPGETETAEEGDSLAEIEKADREAEVIASLCRRMVETAPVLLPNGASAQYGDIVILMRAGQREAEQLAKVFARHKIPFMARRDGFFNCIEVLDLTNILTILDNPLQDIPLLGALRSPIGGFSVEDLAEIRLALPRGSFWDALVTFAAKKKGAALDKAVRFIERIQQWRDLARHSSLAMRLERILEDSGYEDWAAAQEGGAQRRANIRRLIELARQFDELRGEGLYPFLNHVQEQMEQKDAAIGAPSLAAQGAVRLMTIHQSKGLQFPIVIAAGLHKKFNTSDFKELHLIDDEQGLCLKARPPGSRRQYETLGFWRARQRQTRRMVDEEMRILYVALTRAQHRLVLVGSPSAARENSWSNAEGKPPRAPSSMLDWIGPWLAGNHPAFLTEPSGAAPDWTWEWHSTLDQRPEISDAQPDPFVAFASEHLEKLRARLESPYPFAPASMQEAKSSATALRRGLSDEPELARPIIRPQAKNKNTKPASTLQGREAGQATHRFLEHARFSALTSERNIRAEIEALAAAEKLTPEEAAAIDPEKILSFWTSPFGSELLQQPETLRRELVFTARFSRADLITAGVPSIPDIGAHEFIVVQGAADLAAIRPEEIWLVDFKTDRVPADMLEERLAGYLLQVRLYAAALRKIYKRPVTRACLHFLESNRTEWLSLRTASLL
jgi:ATP-dependent helicase/nuclease subunit A